MCPLHLPSFVVTAFVFVDVLEVVFFAFVSVKVIFYVCSLDLCVTLSSLIVIIIVICMDKRRRALNRNVAGITYSINVARTLQSRARPDSTLWPNQQRKSRDYTSVVWKSKNVKG